MKRQPTERLRADAASDGHTLFVWRHPRPEGAKGLCVGAGCDLPVSTRRAKRLARRIQAHARRHQLPHEIWTSGLRRCAEVGRWLRRWGWRHHIDAALRELDFGRWDGRPWAEISKAEIDTWVQDFATATPGGGESLVALLARASSWTGGQLVVSHGGWMLARRWMAEHPGQTPSADQWPAPPAYGACWALPSARSIAAAAGATFRPQSQGGPSGAQSAQSGAQSGAASSAVSGP
ncbi:alpha-ribazole phosphatase [Roseateles sp. YR242]|uniref:histidine phosphatase family protein n=1 Tax=Roseateles sp. YR242 TaxID=1855305 RepID=UPI0008D486A5|nr:histidine phosphatase family protein [Roseateles sp. YR242]SEK60909.1 alpha-ribazole phosphatase [Roseateles sp. YR242]